MANTEPRPTIDKRPSDELLEDLCIELRHVACGEGNLPNGERVIRNVREVSAIHTELASRHVDCQGRLKRLSQETSWQMPELLDDCLAYPQRLPYVREPDGIRRYLRCQLCSKAERPSDAKLFWFCDACMRNVLSAVRQRTTITGIVLFRTYNSECRCSHADGDTVLACAGAFYSDHLYGACEKCIQDELERRRVA
jgi:hypothetical protein